MQSGVRMSCSAALQELAKQVRSDTVELLDAAQPKWLTYAPLGTSNHILWHAGHALWLQDVLCIQMLLGHGELPPGWNETFGMNCQPISETTDWPSRPEVRKLLTAQLGRILHLLESVTESKLQEITDPARGPAIVADRIIHGFHDEAKHSGEMYLLFKMCRADSKS